MSEQTFTFPNYELAASVSGLQDRHLKIISECIPVSFVARGDTVIITGEEAAVNSFYRCLEELVFLAKEGSSCTEEIGRAHV